jgi:carbonic anhydrase
VNFAYASTILLSGGSLHNPYRVAGVHFHWGKSDVTGSEHTVDDKHFPLEMHIVTFDEVHYKDVQSAVNGNDSLAVLGVLFKMSDQDNPDLQPLVSRLKDVAQPGHPIEIPYFDIGTLLPQNYNKHFYRYMGSLTTPPCAQSVIWTVAATPVPISRAQLEEFRHVYEEKEADGSQEYLRHNWRHTQPIQKRVVLESFQRSRSHLEDASMTTRVPSGHPGSPQLSIASKGIVAIILLMQIILGIN